MIDMTVSGDLDTQAASHTINVRLSYQIVTAETPETQILEQDMSSTGDPFNAAANLVRLVTGKALSRINNARRCTGDVVAFADEVGITDASNANEPPSLDVLAGLSIVIDGEPWRAFTAEMAVPWDLDEAADSLHYMWRAAFALVATVRDDAVSALHTQSPTRRFAAGTKTHDTY